MTGAASRGDPWDIHMYCSIVDNHGDIGVCWRVARQLAAEHGHRVTLWVDDWPGARVLIAALPALPAAFRMGGVAVRPWSEAADEADCTGDVLIEAFGCELPAATLGQLAARARKPVWIDLEYFSAERWVAGFHGRSGWDPAGRAQRWMYFPGPGDDAGGLLRERGLIAARDAWGEAEAQGLARRLGLPRRAGALHALCFAYAGAPYADMLAALAASSPGGVDVWLCGPQPQAAVGRLSLPAGTAAVPAPFVPQDAFDRLLWSADVLFVRGEDSLVRAVWSGRPFVWHIYPQAEGAHFAKLDAWLERYTAGFSTDVRNDYVALNRAWNGAAPGSDLARAWVRLAAVWGDWVSESRRASRALAQTRDMTAGLVDFIARRRPA